MNKKLKLIKKKILSLWTKVSEDNRKKFISSLSVILNLLVNACLISIPVTLLFHFPYWKSVICIWIFLPFFEHYYIWIREKWKDQLL